MVRRVSVTGRERNGEKQRRRTGEIWEDEMVTHRALLRQSEGKKYESRGGCQRKLLRWVEVDSKLSGDGVAA